MERVPHVELVDFAAHTALEVIKVCEKLATTTSILIVPQADDVAWLRSSWQSAAEAVIPTTSSSQTPEVLLMVVPSRPVVRTSKLKRRHGKKRRRQKSSAAQKGKQKDAQVANQ